MSIACRHQLAIVPLTSDIHLTPFDKRSHWPTIFVGVNMLQVSCVAQTSHSTDSTNYHQLMPAVQSLFEKAAKHLDRVDILICRIANSICDKEVSPVPFQVVAHDTIKRYVGLLCVETRVFA